MIGCLILHGYTGGPQDVKPLVDYLKGHTIWDIEVPTLPGHGSKLALGDVSHKNWIDAAENALYQLKEKYDEIYLIGFSMGGMIAAYLAAKYKVDKLVLLATAGKYISFKQLSINISAVIGDGLKGNLTKNKNYLYYKNKFGEVPFKANIEFLRLIKFTRRYLKKVESPVLIAQGQQDGLVPAKAAYYLDKEITSKQKEIVFFERSKHLICLGNDKDVLNIMIYNFLTKEKS